MSQTSAAESYSEGKPLKPNGFQLCFKNIFLGSVFAYVSYNFFYAIKNFRDDAAQSGIQVRPATDLLWMVFSALCHIVSQKMAFFNLIGIQSLIRKTFR